MYCDTELHNIDVICPSVDINIRAATSSYCGGLVAFGHLEGPSGPLDSCKKKKNWTPIFFIGGPHLYPPCRHPPYPLHIYIFFFTTTPIFVPIWQFFNFTTHFTTNFTTNHYQYYHPPPTTCLYLRETQENVLRGLQRFWGGCKVLYLRETQANVC